MPRGTSARRLAMGEVAWAGYQRERKNEKSRRCRLRVIDVRRRKRAGLVQLLGGRCVVCDFDKPWPECYDFHHLDKKLKRWQLGDCDHAWEDLKVEAAKCVLLCAVCHRAVERGRIRRKFKLHRIDMHAPLPKLLLAEPILIGPKAR